MFKLLIFIAVLLAFLHASAQSASSPDASMSSLKHYVTLIAKDTSIVKLKRDSLQFVSGVLINKILNSNKQPGDLFLACLYEDINVLKDIANKTKMDTLTRNANITNITNDIRLKCRLGNYNHPNDKGEILFELFVQVSTRILVKHQFRPVSGYRIYANPWIVHSIKPAKIKFTNSTNPGTKEKLPPGRYFIWAESADGSPKIFPKKVEYTDIGMDPSKSLQKIFIDVQ